MHAFGIAALILSAAAIIVPIAGVYLTLICAVLGALSIGRKGFVFALASAIVSTVNLLALSPSPWAAAGLAGAVAGDPDGWARVAGSMVGLLVLAQGASVVISGALTVVFPGSGPARRDRRTRECPACGNFVSVSATVCPHCRLRLAGA